MKIQIGRITFEDTMDKIHITDCGIDCCGRKIRMVAHVDGRGYYSYTYYCECGNVIKSKTERVKGDIIKL